MVHVPRTFAKVFLIASSLVFCATLLPSPRASQRAQQTQPDNTKKNRDQAPPTCRPTKRE